MSFLLSRVLSFQGHPETKELKESWDQLARRVPRVIQVSGDKKVTRDRCAQLVLPVKSAGQESEVSSGSKDR